MTMANINAPVSYMKVGGCRHKGEAKVQRRELNRTKSRRIMVTELLKAIYHWFT